MTDETPSISTDTNISNTYCITISDEESDIDDPAEVVNNGKCEKKKSSPKTHLCNICNKTFSKNCSLKTHYLIHAGVKPFICEVCYKTFTKKSTLVVHSTVHTGERNFVCNICEKRFARKTDLQKHILIHTGEKPYICELCEKRFNHQSNLRKHRITHTREKSHICDICRQAFSHRDVLLNHLKNHVEESIKKGNTTDRENLTIRSYLKTVIKKNFHPCDKCDKSFIRSDRLKKHKLTHSTNITVNHVCEVCNAKFKTKENLQEHLLNHVVLTFNFDDLDGSDDVDDPNFNDLGDRDHISSTPTADVQPVENSKSDNTCSICFKTFSRKTSLRVHYLVHSGSKPHKCTLCEKSFAQKATLKRHLQVHTEERPFTCEICKKNFARKTSLRKHYISHSSKKLF